MACRPPASHLDATWRNRVTVLVGAGGRLGVSGPARVDDRVRGLGRRQEALRIGAERPATPPLDLSVPLAGVKTLTLTTRPPPRVPPSGLGVWQAAVVRAGADVEPMFGGRKLKPAEIDMYRRQEGADDYTFDLKGTAKGPFFVAAKCWEDEIDPAVPPRPKTWVGRSRLATPGEYEPINLVVYAVDDLKDVAVTSATFALATPCCFRRPPSTSASCCGRLMRDVYTLPPERSTVVSRFLLPYQTLDIPAGTFREYHVIVHVPEDASAGQVHGHGPHRAGEPSAAGGAGHTSRCCRSAWPGRKTRPMASTTAFRRPDEDWSHVETELADIHEHGCTTLKSDLGVRYELVDGRVVPNLDEADSRG